jgi:hypothetical protein
MNYSSFLGEHSIMKLLFSLFSAGCILVTDTHILMTPLTNACVLPSNFLVQIIYSYERNYDHSLTLDYLTRYNNNFHQSGAKHEDNKMLVKQVW